MKAPWRMKHWLLIGVIWASANLAAYAGIDYWERHELSQKYDVPVSTLYSYEPRTVPMQLAGSERIIDLWYRLLKPTGSSPDGKFPVLIFLHGAGSRGSDNVRQLHSLPILLAQEPYRSQFPCYVIVPQCPEHYSWSSYFQLGGNDNSDPKHNPVLAMLNDVLSHYPADRSRVYLCGFSMGGHGSWDLASSVPDRFAAVVPVAGGGDPKQVISLVHTPVWNVHSVDDEVVPVTQSQELINALRAAGGQPKYTEYTHAGHGSWTPAFRDSNEILTWMFQQSRSSSTHLAKGAIP